MTRNALLLVAQMLVVSNVTDEDHYLNRPSLCAVSFQKLPSGACFCCLSSVHLRILTQCCREITTMSLPWGQQRDAWFIVHVIYLPLLKCPDSTVCMTILQIILGLMRRQREERRRRWTADLGTVHSCHPPWTDSIYHYFPAKGISTE